ncbi:hypothetical protein BX616_005958 [Lobosporangium transversale]|nr:hypothetical protein BX616_005958 [Lobosporangium transversale]
MKAEKLVVEHNNVPHRIRVSAGPNLHSLRPLNTNDDANPMLIDTDEFIGHVMLRVRGQNQIHGYEEGQRQDGLKVMPDSEWFDKAAAAGRGNLLMSLQVVGRFKREWTGEQVVFACQFSKPFKLPPLANLVVKFFKVIDPACQLDIQGPKPYCISPALGTMNTINVLHDPVSSKSTPTERDASSLTGNPLLPSWPSPNGENLFEDTSVIILEDDLKKKNKLSSDNAARRSHFGKAKYLQKHRFVQDHVYGFELFNSFLDCSRFALKVPGLSLDLFKYLNDQPLTLALKTQDDSASFVYVLLELVPVVDDLLIL